MQNDNPQNSGELILPIVYGDSIPKYSVNTMTYPNDMRIGMIGIAVIQDIVLQQWNDGWDWVDKKNPLLGYERLDGRFNKTDMAVRLDDLIVIANDTTENRNALKRSVRVKRGDCPSNVRIALYAKVKDPRFRRKGKLIELDPDEEEAPQGTEDKSARTAAKQ